jgi:hypothetical protein
MPPEGPTKAARMQSWADEKAQISCVTPAASRMHQLSALAMADDNAVAAAHRPMARGNFMVGSAKA